MGIEDYIFGKLDKKIAEEVNKNKPEDTSKINNDEIEKTSYS